jgi:hypothetical protein
MKQQKKIITLYDAGGLWLIFAFFGLPLGVIFDYFWNLLVFSIVLPRLPSRAGNTSIAGAIGKGKKAAYIFFVTLLGIIIDWAYVELIWDIGIDITKSPSIWVAVMGQPLQLASMLIPILMLWAVDAALSYAFLRLERKQALVLGGLMAVFTAPWLLFFMPYILGWAV